MRRAARRDDNESSIVRALKQAGASVHRLNDKGVPDLVVGIFGKMFLLEVKSATGKLTPAQERFIKTWKGPPPIVVRTEWEALFAVGAVTRRVTYA
jgi:Holliday junction resolvase